MRESLFFYPQPAAQTPFINSLELPVSGIIYELERLISPCENTPIQVVRSRTSFF